MYMYITSNVHTFAVINMVAADAYAVILTSRGDEYQKGASLFL